MVLFIYLVIFYNRSGMTLLIWKRTDIGCKKGYTLAEVLITLGIIGVLTAMVIPTLVMKSSQNTVIAKLREDVATVSLAVERGNGNEGIPLDTADSDMAAFKDVYLEGIAPYLNTSEVCYNEAGCWASETKTLTGSNPQYWHQNVGIGSEIITIKLPNGSNISLDIYGKSDIWNSFGVQSDDARGMVIFIDANGDTRPNVIGKDIYAVVYTSRGVLAAGADKSYEEVENNCSVSATGTNAGYFCLAKLQHDNWKIDNRIWMR